jgi:hypothetical protein
MIDRLTKYDAPDVVVLADCVWDDFVGRNTTGTSGPGGTVLPAPTDLYGPGWTPSTTTKDFVNIQRVCRDRHSKGINVGFRDGSARWCKLSDLWKLRWNALSVPLDVTGMPAGY